MGVITKQEGSWRCSPLLRVDAKELFGSHRAMVGGDGVGS